LERGTDFDNLMHKQPLRDSVGRPTALSHGADRETIRSYDS
jgi:hypothetical protein